MIETLEQTFCRDCSRPIILPEKRGPHPREFCNGTCRKRWQRKHQKPQQKAGNATIDTIEAESRIAELERELAERDELIEKLTSKKSNNPLKRSLQEKLTRVLEQRDWPRLDIHYRVNPGRKEGLAFILGASIELLSRALNQLEAEQS